MGFPKVLWPGQKSGPRYCDRLDIFFTNLMIKSTDFLCLNLVPVGKSLGNGHPIAAAVTTKEIAKKFNSFISYFNYLGTLCFFYKCLMYVHIKLAKDSKAQNM